ncbi:ComF family protein [Nonomuraea indica]|uniref:ComF family protein n=1 Tax=Nonomuraea indica TaxID=1581193 RepID=A0ABW8A3J9_9ACTN
MTGGILADVSRALLDLLLPQRCAGCDAPGEPFCGPCLAGLVAPARRLPEPRPAGLPDCWSAADYAGPVRRALIAYKERARVALAAPLAEALACTVAAGVAGRPHPAAAGFVLVPVPSARRTRRARGHDPVGRLAARAAGLLTACGHAARSDAVLAPIRPVADQAGLDARRRAANLAGSLGVAGRATPALPVVLVDDLVTTGATLSEAARALRSRGAEVLFAATVAATRRRS